MEITLDYEPRNAFVDFHQRNERFGAMVCHRRAGKTVAAVHDLIIRALYTTKKNAKYGYIGPFRQQAKEIAWEYLKNGTEGIRKGPPRESDLRVTFHNGATITLYGADNPDSLRGIYFDGVVLDEYGDMRPGLWGEVILPTLLDRQGWAIFIGTMRGKNHFFKMLQRAENEPTWFYKKLKASESGLLSEADLNEARAEMTEAQYEQEMECNPDAAVTGTYYANLIGAAERQGRVGDYPYDPTQQVHCAADLGFTDSTAFWFWQLTENGPNLIDYYEDDGKDLAHYFAMLKSKGYDYADMWLPHDAKAKSLQTGRSTVEQFIAEGFPCKVVTKLAVQHGIDAARMILPQCTFHVEQCYSGIEALRAYRRSYNEKAHQYSNAPLHDWSSNGADAFRMFALVTELEVKTQQVVKDESLWTPPEITLDSLWKDKESDWRSSIIRL
jgi:hypothetical protein